MAPKASPAAGAKKKTVVRTVRRVVKKPKAPASSASPPAAADEATAPTPASDLAATPVSASNTACPSTIEETPTAPASTPVSASNTACPSTIEATPTAPASTLDTTPEASVPTTSKTPALETTPEPSQPAAAEIPAPKTTLEASGLEPASDPSDPTDANHAIQEVTPEPSKLAAEKPKVTKVRKVVVKKIVIKKVPKGTSSAAKDKKEEVEKAVPLQAENSTLATVASEDLGAMEQNNRDAAEAVAATAGDVVMSERAEDAGGDVAMPEGRRRKKTEVFVGGLDREAKEEDLRKVFGKAGEIVEVRMMMDQKTGKNKGYAFVRYAEQAQAKKAIAEFAKVEVCGKTCGAAALEGKDTIFLGNIDKTWKKEDVMKLLQESGIEKIDTITVMSDPNNMDLNRGFAFLELETNRDAQLTYKKLQKKDAFGKGLNVKVSWAEPFNDPDEEEMQKVKSVYVDGLPSSWNEDRVRESFKKFGEIERVVLARNIHSAKRKDFAFVNYATRKSAVLCIESIEKEGLIDNGTKVNFKVSLAKPVQKDKQNKGGSKFNNKNSNKEKPKTVERNSKSYLSSNKGKPLQGMQATDAGDKKSSTTHELLHVLREQATWKQEQIGYAEGPTMQDYTHALYGGKRPFSALGVDATTDFRDYHRARVDSFTVPSSSYVALAHGLSGPSLSYYQSPGVLYPHGTLSAASDHSSTQRSGGGFPYGGNSYY